MWPLSAAAISRSSNSRTKTRLASRAASEPIANGQLPTAPARPLHCCYASVRAPHLRLRQPSRTRTPTRMLRPERASRTAKAVQEKIGGAGTKRPRTRQPVRMPRPVRTWSKHRDLSRSSLVWPRNRSRRGRNYRQPHHRRKASRAPENRRLMPEQPLMRTPQEVAALID